MIAVAAAIPSVVERRQARRLAVWNAAVWAIGNGLAGTTLITYLAKEIGAARLGLSIGLILAAPQVVGLLRLGAPAMIDRLAGRKPFCIGMFFMSALTLSALPWVCSPGRLPSPRWSLAALVLLWCLYHVLQYLAAVALWSWLADAAPTRIRGRFFGRRERWSVAGTAAAAIAAGAFDWGLVRLYPGVSHEVSYTILTLLGAGFMLAALAPLYRMPSCFVVRPFRLHNAGETGDWSIFRPKNMFCGQTASRKDGPVPFQHRENATFWQHAKKPFIDARFLPLLLFGCWFSFCNGITQSAQNYYPMQVLGVSLFLSLSLQTCTRLGQWAASPRLGALADRRGNRPVMIACQLLAAAGLLPLAAATPAHWQWLFGAWALWIAYAGLNVCLPNWMLKLSPRESNTSYIAAFYAAGGLCYAVAAILGGAMVDCCRTWMIPLGGGRELPFFVSLFVFGWIARSLGALILAFVQE